MRFHLFLSGIVFFATFTWLQPDFDTSVVTIRDTCGSTPVGGA